MTHVLIADDDRLLSRILTKILQIFTNGYWQISHAYSGNEALELAHRLKPDLIILDDEMPQLRGSEVAQRLRAAGNNVAIFMLTAELGSPGDEQREIECLKIGCDDFMFKPYKSELLYARIQALLRRRGELFQLDNSGEVLNYADVEVDTSAHTVRRGSRRLELTLREYSLLSLFLRHPRQVLDRGLILDRVWGQDYEGSSNVVDVYIGYLRTKLELQGEKRLIQTIRGVGYVLRELVEGK